MTKMLAIDLDETLLHTDKTISGFSVDILKRACFNIRYNRFRR
jgi:hydroxymethylpyrimidine pyrophosphatase-like HAD family hydrolase